MAKGGPEPQQSSADNSLDLLWLVVICILAVVFIWYFGKVYISTAVLKIRAGEIIAIRFVLEGWGKLLSFFGLPGPDLSVLNNWLHFASTHYGSALEFQWLERISDAVGKYLRFPAAIILILISVWLYNGSIANRFKNTYDIAKFRDLEKVNWPHISPVVHLDLIKTSLDEGPWAMALTPMAFCKKYHLINEEMKDGKIIAVLRKGTAHRIFSLQLGSRWSGVENLPIHLKALFAVFAARVDGDKKTPDQLLAQISTSSEEGKSLDFTGTMELLKKHANSKAVKKIVSLHAYVATVLASLLTAAREVGVLASSEFLWLKPVDRRMWYVLNGVGRQTSVVEIAGVYAHWVAEKKIGLPLEVPMVEEAVKGMELALTEIIYKPAESMQ
jgi:intracellular multiplication protein IcmP